jgi:hypothetical protein
MCFFFLEKGDKPIVRATNKALSYLERKHKPTDRASNLQSSRQSIIYLVKATKWQTKWCHILVESVKASDRAIDKAASYLDRRRGTKRQSDLFR